MNKAINSKKKLKIFPLTKKYNSIRKDRKSNRIKVFHPAAQAPSVPTLIFGYICRMFVIWLALTGMMFFICDAAGITSKIVDAQFLMLVCAAVTAVFSVACINKITFPVVMLASAGGIVYYLYNLPHNYNPIDFVYDSAVAFFNTLLERLVSVGYTSLGMYGINSSERIYVFGRNPLTPLIRHSLIAIAIVLGMVFVFSVIKRINIPVLLIFGGAVIVAVFTYNISSSNTGFAMVLAAFCGIIVMKMYERRYMKALKIEVLYEDSIKSKGEIKAEKRAEKKLKKADAKAQKKSGVPIKKVKAKPEKQIKKPKTPEEKKADRISRKEKKKARFKCTATGGFTGFAVTAVALLAVWIPAQTTDDRLGTIEFIDNYMQNARLYVTAYLMGDDVDLNALSLYNGQDDLSPRTMDFNSPQYNGTKLLEVDTSYNTPVYLRSWVGTRYDYNTGTWYSADDKQILAYRKKFGENFSPEDITYNFYNYIIPSVTNIKRYDTYKNNIQYGFMTMQVNVTRVSGSGALMYIPSFMNTGIGLLEFNSTEPLSYKYSSYFDGVYTSRLFAANKKYSAVSFVTSMRHDEFGTNFRNNLTIYQLMCENIDMADALLNQYPLYDPNAAPDEDTGEIPLHPEIESFVLSFDSTLESFGITVRGSSAMRRYVKMTAQERNQFRESIKLENEYRSYVYDTYLGTSGETYLMTKANDIASQANSSYTHDIVMSVINYLSDNMTYTLTPTAPANEQVTALEAFLEDTKEGYCVHFATTAIVLLRELGIPARYAEGYIASQFSRNYTKDAPTRYHSNVYDYNAHAWVEVYYPGFGWMQYEATPPYMSDMYEPLVSSTKPYTSPSDYASPTIQPETAPIIDDDSGSYAEMRAKIITICVTAATALLILIIIYITANRMIKKADRAILDRSRTIESAKSESEYDIEGSSRKLAKKINDFILSLYSALGVPPETGELPSEYASRLSKDFATLSRHDLTHIVTIIEKEEFGYGLTYKELYTLADYLNDITHAAYSGLSPLQKLKMRYIKRVL